MSENQQSLDPNQASQHPPSQENLSSDQQASPYATPAQDPEPVAMGAPQAPDLPYPKNLLVDALSYPFRGWGKYMLLISVILTTIIGAVWLVPILGWLAGIIVWAMIIGMCCNIMMNSINMPQLAPEWPDFSDTGSDLVVPLLRFGFLGFLLLVLPCFFVAQMEYEQNPSGLMLQRDLEEGISKETALFLYLLIYFFGSSYLAFSMLAMSFLGTFQGLLPHNVLQLFWRSMPQSWYLLLILFLLTFVQLISGYLSEVNSFLPFLLIAPINAYFFMVIARFLGRLYGVKQTEIGWFAS